MHHLKKSGHNFFSEINVSAFIQVTEIFPTNEPIILLSSERQNKVWLSQHKSDV